MKSPRPSWATPVILAASAAFAVPSADAQFQDLWQIGVEDVSVAEFAQESGAGNSPPGSATVLDDDYYLQGSYPQPIGMRAQDEDWMNFERAVTHTDRDVRIHFNLDARQAHPDSDFRLDLFLFGGGYWDALVGAAGLNFAGFGTHDVDILFNGTPVFSDVNIQTGYLVDETFNAGAVSAVPGANTVTIRRVGGDSEQNGGSSGWIVFDYVRMAADSSTVVVDGIETFTASPVAIRPGQGTTLYWLAEADGSVSIDQGIGNVDAQTVDGAGSIRVNPTSTTTYTLTLTPAVGAPVQESVTVNVEAVAEFRQLWLIGNKDGSQAEFGQESFAPNPPPGSATLKDDDYYLMGEYPAPIGVLAMDEPWLNVERAVTSGDPDGRFHFVLDPVDAHPQTVLRLSIDLIAGGYWDAAIAAAGSNFGGFGTHDVTVAFNGVEIFNQTDIQSATPVLRTFEASEVNAVAGPNLITVTRTGGDSEQIGGNSGWIQYDFLELEADSSAVPCLDGICAFTAGSPVVQPGASTSLFWLVSPSASVSIDQGIGNVDAITSNGAGSILITPTGNTTYTLTATQEGMEPVTQTVTVEVALINTFTASVAEVRSGESVQLTWSVDPDATLTLEPGFGDVTDLTIGGAGFLDITPTETTTYVLTATRGADSVQAEVTVTFNPFTVLWQIGIVDDNQAEFSQENGSPNDPPGSEFGLDDDFYLAGTYPDPVGLLLEDEPFLNFERAVTSGDLNNRVHFNLTPEQSAPSAQLRLLVDLMGGGWPDGTDFGDHDIVISMNGNTIFEQAGIDQDTLVDETFSAGSVNAAAGENIIQVTRTGGDSAGNGTNSGWIQFDYLRLEGMFSEAAPLRMTDVQYDPLLSELTIRWNSRIGRTYSVQTSEDLDVWIELVDGYPGGGATSDETSYVFPVDPDVGTVLLRVVEEN